MDTAIRLSPPEKQTLKRLAAGEHDPFFPLDWVALQRLKRLGLAKEQSIGRGVRITKEGVRAEEFRGEIV